MYKYLAVTLTAAIILAVAVSSGYAGDRPNSVNVDELTDNDLTQLYDQVVREKFARGLVSRGLTHVHHRLTGQAMPAGCPFYEDDESDAGESTDDSPRRYRRCH